MQVEIQCLGLRINHIGLSCNGGAALRITASSEQEEPCKPDILGVSYGSLAQLFSGAENTSCHCTLPSAKCLNLLYVPMAWCDHSNQSETIILTLSFTYVIATFVYMDDHFNERRSHEKASIDQRSRISDHGGNVTNQKNRNERHRRRPAQVQLARSNDQDVVESFA